MRYQKECPGIESINAPAKIDGDEVEKVLPSLTEKKQYELGVKAGKIFARIHKAATLDKKPENWHDRYLSAIEPRLEAYRAEGIFFEGADAILDYIEKNKDLLSKENSVDFREIITWAISSSRMKRFL